MRQFCWRVPRHKETAVPPVNWGTSHGRELKDNRSEEERELIMNLSPAYIQQCEAWKEEGNLEDSPLWLPVC